MAGDYTRIRGSVATATSAEWSERNLNTEGRTQLPREFLLLHPSTFLAIQEPARLLRGAKSVPDGRRQVGNR